MTLRGIIEYGDAGDPAQPATDRANARAAHLLGRPVRHHDEAGLTVVGAADFKGNVLRTTRQVIADGPILATYTAAAASGWQVAPFQVDWTPRAGQDQAARDAELLAPTGYRTDATYDALNRVATQVLPAAAAGTRSELRPVYDRAGALAAVTLDGVSHVQRIAYNAKGQRTLIAHGNGIMTRYAYHPLTFRLVRMRTERYTASDGPAYHPTGAPIADQGYDHDLVGNVLAIRDRTPGSGIPNHPDAAAITDPVLRGLIAAGDALNRQFTYDPVYRLRSATGRESAAAPPGDPWAAGPRGTDVTQTQAYAQAYSYDVAGNLTGLVHSARGGINRTFTGTAAGGDNRLAQMRLGTTDYDYSYDASGNVLTESTSRQFAWNHADRLAAFATQTPGAEPSIHAQYLYDASGQRVTKLVRRQGGTVEVTRYVGGVFEHHRWGIGTASPGENNHVHVLDDQQRVALVRIGPAHPEDSGPAVAYHLPDHLGSSTAVLDGTGTLTNREEYTPYGETSFGSYTRKRYRFTGMERDEESGLSYHSARYYAPWLCRWASPDPTGAGGGLNLYAYAAANPMRLLDPGGHQPKPPTTAQAVADQVQAVDTLHERLTVLENDVETATRTLVRSIQTGDPFDVDKALVPLDRRAKAILEEARALDVTGRALARDAAAAGSLRLRREMTWSNNRLRAVAGRATNEATRVAAMEWAGNSGPNLGKSMNPPPKLSVAIVRQGGGAWATVRRWLRFGGRSASYAIALGAIISDPGVKTVVQQATGIAFTAGVEAVTRLALGRAAFAGAGFIVGSLPFIPSDSVQYNEWQEQQEVDNELNERAGNYWDSHPGITMAQARQHIVDQDFVQGLEQLVEMHTKKFMELRSAAAAQSAK
jgi:RHS repeat-associated protein